MSWSITEFMIRAPKTLRRKSQKVSEIQTQAVTYDSNAHLSLSVHSWVKACPLQVFLALHKLYTSISQKKVHRGG